MNTDNKKDLRSKAEIEKSKAEGHAAILKAKADGAKNSHTENLVPLSSVKGYGVEDLRKAFDAGSKSGFGEGFDSGQNVYENIPYDKSETFEQFLSSLPNREATGKNGLDLHDLEKQLDKLLNEPNAVNEFWKFVEKKRQEQKLREATALPPKTLSAEEVLSKHLHRNTTYRFDNIIETGGLLNDFVKLSVDAMYEFHNQFSKEETEAPTSLRWVKLGEKELPPDETELFVKYIDMSGNQHKGHGWIDTVDGERRIRWAKEQTQFNFGGYCIGYMKSFEWLEETEALPSKKEEDEVIDFAEWIRIENYLPSELSPMEWTDNNGNYFSSKELYKIYKESCNQSLL